MLKKLLAITLLAVTTLGATGQNTMTVEMTDGSSRLFDMYLVSRVTFTYETPGLSQAVDLGLSVKWASCNVGASHPEESGYYYGWGETMPNLTYTAANSRWWAIPSASLVAKSVVDADGNLAPLYDPASTHWGESWRLPTHDEIDELINDCKWIWTTVNDVEGYRVVGPNGNSIFLPAGGYYEATTLVNDAAYGYFWSSAPVSDDDELCYCLTIDESAKVIATQQRYFGQNVRAVADFSETDLRVVTGDATSVTFHSASLGATATGFDFASPLTSAGFCVGENELINVNNSTVVSVTPSADMSASVYGLLPETTYYYRAFVRSGDEVYYGLVGSFETTEATYTNLYMLGSATSAGWDEKNPIELNKSGNTFVYEGPLNEGELKCMLSTGSWGVPFIRPATDQTTISVTGAASPDVIYTMAPDHKWRVSDAGYYRLEFDLEQRTIDAEFIRSLAVETNTLYIIGDATSAGWSLADAIELTQDVNNPYLFTGTVTLSPGTFKGYLTNDSFDNPAIHPTEDYAPVSATETSTTAIYYGSSVDYKWKIAEGDGGDYTLTFDLENMTFTAVKDNGSEPQEDGALYLIGDATKAKWNLGEAIELTPDANNARVFSWTGPLIAGEFKACTSTASYDDPFIHPVGDNVELSTTTTITSDIIEATTPDYKWVVPEGADGIYALTFDLDQMTFSAAFVKALPTTVYMIGNATPAGWSMGDVTSLTRASDNPMLFTWTGPMAVGEMKACTEIDGSFSCPFFHPVGANMTVSTSAPTVCDIDFYAAGEDYKWVFTSAGIYHIEFDVENNTFKAFKVSDSTPAVYMTGSATPGGSNGDAACEFMRQPAGSYIYTWTGELTAGDFTAAFERSGNASALRPSESSVNVGDGGMTDYGMVLTDASDCTWHVTASGRYRITFDLLRWCMVAEYLGSTIHSAKAPLYWSVYEYCFEEEQKHNPNITITSEQWDMYLDWVAQNLKPAGYDMVCTDGMCLMYSHTSDSPYMTLYGSVTLKELAKKCNDRGLKLGVYDNPLWIHDKADSDIFPGTNYTYGSFKYQSGQDNVLHPECGGDNAFSWAVPSHPGVREYIDGFFKYYKEELGVEFIRMDFMSWFEDGTDRGLGTVGYGYGREEYLRGLTYIAESAQKYGVFVSMVMPHLYHNAIVESQTGQMARIVADTNRGGWWQFSSCDRGIVYPTWSNCNNMFDGFVYWSKISGKDKMILDGDFTRLNKFDNDDEKRSVITLQLMAGGPIAAADQPSTIATGDLQFYTNPEVLSLNTDRFVGKPLSTDLGSTDSQIWYGQMSDGSYVVALFNRENDWEQRTVDLTALGINGSWQQRDMWARSDKDVVTGTLSHYVPGHGCLLLKLTPPAE